MYQSALKNTRGKTRGSAAICSRFYPNPFCHDIEFENQRYNSGGTKMNDEAIVERDSMEVDIVIVGAGPSGLSAAIRLMQLASEKDHELSVCIVEKGSEVGAHILSGAVLETRALDELIPDWKEKGAPLNTPVTAEKMMFLSKTGATSVPGLFLPLAMHNKGNYIISLGNLCRWLGEQAEALGVEIYPGFAAS
jgi:electron-transferring-flavoprotein dehydrogenase